MEKPIKKFVAFPVSASVWENTIKKDDKEIKVYNVSINKAYKDKEGNWKSTDSMGLADLPKVSLVVSEAYKYLAVEKQQEDNKKE